MITLVGNKIDLEDQRLIQIFILVIILKRQVSKEQIERKINELEINYMEVSAKNGENISSLFKGIANKLSATENNQSVNIGGGSHLN